MFNATFFTSNGGSNYAHKTFFVVFHLSHLMPNDSNGNATYLLHSARSKREKNERSVLLISSNKGRSRRDVQRSISSSLAYTKWRCATEWIWIPPPQRGWHGWIGDRSILVLLEGLDVISNCVVHVVVGLLAKLHALAAYKNWRSRKQNRLLWSVLLENVRQPREQPNNSWLNVVYATNSIACHMVPCGFALCVVVSVVYIAWGPLLLLLLLLMLRF